MNEHPSQSLLFSRSWWLDAVAPGQWAEAAVRRGDEIAARLPYVVRRRRGLRVLGLPPLSPTLGPWLRPSEASYAGRLAEQKDLMRELIDRLPPADLAIVNLPPGEANWLPFHFAGFEGRAKMTYRLTDLSDLDRVWGGVQAKIRTDVRKAAKRVTVRDDLPAQRLADLASMTFARQGVACPYSGAMLGRVVEASVARGCGRTLYAEDAEGRVHAAVFTAWDDACAYYLVSGDDPDLRNSGAGSLLVWEAIRHAATVTRAFDFEGSMIEPVERFVRAFGARQAPYVQVRRAGRRMRAINAARELVRALLGKAPA